MTNNGSATPAQPSRHTGGITITELAEARGISKDAARRLIKAGKVAAHQAAGTHGLTWCVHPDESPPLHQGSATVADPRYHRCTTPARRWRRGRTYRRW